MTPRKGCEKGHMTKVRSLSFPQIVPQTLVPGCLSRADVTTLSTERRTTSKATPSTEPELCAGDLVLVKRYTFIFVSVPVCSFSLHLPPDRPHVLGLQLSELLSIQSAEENDFVLKYSPQVWKGTVNVWLGMYYDTNSK